MVILWHLLSIIAYAVFWLESWFYSFSGNERRARYAAGLSEQLDAYVRRTHEEIAALSASAIRNRCLCFDDFDRIRAIIEKIDREDSYQSSADLLEAAVRVGSPEMVEYVLAEFLEIAPLTSVEIEAIHETADANDLDLWRTIFQSVPNLPPSWILTTLSQEIIEYLTTNHVITEEEQSEALDNLDASNLTDPLIEMLVSCGPDGIDHRYALIEQEWCRDRIRVAAWLIQQLETTEQVSQIFWKSLGNPDLSNRHPKKVARWMIDHCQIDLSRQQYRILFYPDPQLEFAFQRATRDDDVRYYCDTHGHRCIVSKERLTIPVDADGYLEYIIADQFWYTNTMIYHITGERFVSYRKEQIPWTERTQVPWVRYTLKRQNRVTAPDPDAPSLAIEIPGYPSEQRHIQLPPFLARAITSHA